MTIRQQSNVVADANKPWEVAAPVAVKSVTGAGVFVTDRVRDGIGWSFARETLDGVKTDKAAIMFAAANDGGNNLEDFHEIVVGTTTWRIVRTEVLQPGADRILYIFEVA